MTCKGVRSKLSSYLDGEMSGYEMLEMRSHITSCSACQSETDELRKLKWLMSNLPDHEPRQDFAQRLKVGVYASAATSGQRALSLTMVSSLAFAAALVVTLFAMRASRPHAAAVSPERDSAVAQTNFELARDQAYQSGGDPFSDGTMVLTVSAPNNVPH